MEGIKVADAIYKCAKWDADSLKDDILLLHSHPRGEKNIDKSDFFVAMKRYSRYTEKTGMEKEYICADRMFEPGGRMDQIRSMTAEEFEKFIEEEKKKENTK